MVGCCGQRSNEQSTQKGPRNYRVQTITDFSGNRCVPGEDNRSRGKVGNRHDEEICHGTGERRRDLLEQVKMYLGEFDDRPCKTTPPQSGQDAMRSLGSYPEYLKKHCKSWMPPNPRPPYITSVQTHEIRATSDYDKMKGETSEYVSFIDATLKPPVLTCDCVKRNGLQDQCPHPMCKPPTAKCRANNPGPCCPPSLGMGGPPAVLGQTTGARGGFQDLPTETHQQPPPYTTTYHQDFINQHVPATAGTAMSPPMMDVIICKNPATDLPTGKKYLCCPVQIPQ